jgi:hypothetical protein
LLARFNDLRRRLEDEEERYRLVEGGAPGGPPP